ncbi:odorant receptor 19a-like [Drosophila tropicalis]|uniref:odorant receptor 19a-like n=1 Tax=Drosophila tropicalis TaxID=46794 RepID=UPI0035ABA3CD
MPDEVDSMRAFNHHWNLWQLFGMHPPRSKTLWHRYYKIYSVVIITYCFILTPMTLIGQVFVATSLASICEGICVAAPDAFEVLKLANVWRIRDQLQESHRIFRQLDRRLRTQSERQAIHATIRLAKRIFVSIFIVFITLLGTGIMNVLSSKDRILIFPSWIPWDYKKNEKVFLLTSIFNLLGLFMNALCALNNDSYPVTYLTMVAAHLEALSIRASRIGHNPISQCAAIFFLAYVKTNLSRTLHMIVLIVAITNETVFICYAVEVLNQSGEMLSKGIYNCNWLNLSTQFRRDLLIMLMRSQRSTTIMAAGLVTVRLSTIITVIKGSYTLFTLLNAIS